MSENSNRESGSKRVSTTPWYRTRATWIAAIFLLFGIIWILFSDMLLVLLIHDPVTLTRYQTYKGWLFILFTAALIYSLVGYTERLFHHSQQHHKAALDALHRSERRQAAILDSIPDIAWLKDLDARFIAVNKPFAELVGAPSPESLIGKSEFDIMPPELARIYSEDDQEVLRSRTTHRKEEPGIDARGRPIWLETIKAPVFDASGRVVGTAGLSRDVTERKRAQLFEQARNETLDRIIANRPLSDILEGIARSLEAIHPDRRASILLIDQQTGRWTEGVAPALPRDYFRTLQGMLVAADGVPGGAASTGETMIVEDIASHPQWVACRESAARAGIVACWSLPFKDDTGKLLGSFAVHHRHSATPTPEDTALLGEFTRLTGLAVQRARSEARMEYLAHFDPLTDLPNRLLMQSRLHHALQRAQRDQQQVAVLFLDLDHFKKVNDSLGHPVGDELLAAIARRLRLRLREADTLARLGGDEFLVVLENIHQPEYAANVAESLIELLQAPFRLPSGHEVFVGVSIGISLYPTDGTDVTELIRNADIALYQAKIRGPNSFQFHTVAQSRAAGQRLQLETLLRHGLEHGEIIVHYQPLIDIADDRPVGVEALVRWNLQGQLIPPDEFIPIAEDTGLIVPLGARVLREACLQMADWRAVGLPLDTLAVNLSPRQLRRQDLALQVDRILKETDLPAEVLELELTESTIMEQGERAISLLAEFKRLGVRIAIDDFGTGYSSLAYLKRFPIDKLKIDRSFVEGLPGDKDDREIVATIINMAHGLHLQVVAEGVETRQQLEFLQARGCDHCQGYLFCKPLPAPEVEKWLRERADLLGLR